ncbi:cytochrome c5 family protein [Mangrovimicrobium sediminis]|uniref:Cytochrome c5 family protein n=2 Tax=Mangrovimicrobium sediminis TaxID=2562682 RepID=A0A4Z0LX28_9GAMM|nr:cytochrome c5 family protein [Haliea sp. SAOS-164]
MPAAAADYPEFPGERLALGRSVWLDTCEGCHGYGIAGAPLATDAQQWAPRVAKGRETLYSHALEGFFGPRSTMMPARGGNEALNDEEVTAAVDYMVMLATGQSLP